MTLNFVIYYSYILSPETSVLSGLDASITDASYTDLDLFYIAELYDFALKDGNTPSLQTFKFIHAWWLADLGFEQESQAYCESIINAIGSNDHSMFIERFKQVSHPLLESTRFVKKIQYVDIYLILIYTQ